MGDVTHKTVSRGGVRWVILAACVVAGLSVVAALLVSPVRDSPPDKLILISIDTLRADHLGYMGYRRPTSPHIDHLATESLNFRHAFSNSAVTLPSHATMFTSLYPSVHGAKGLQLSDKQEYAVPLADRFLTLAEILHDRGFRTAAFTEGGYLDSCWNLDQGFEVYNSHYLEDGVDVLEEILDRAGAWLAEHREEPFFCFIHSYVVHGPWTPRPPYDRMFDEGYTGPIPFAVTEEQLIPFNEERHGVDNPVVRHLVSLYDGEIRYMDEQIGAFLRQLDDLGLADKTILVFTSDHGEEWGEHGYSGRHGHTLFDEIVHVPLLMRIPGVRPQEIEQQASLIDLAPTLLSLLHVDPGAAPFQGRDLLVHGPGAVEERPVFSEIVYDQRHIASLRTPRQKLVAWLNDHFFRYDLQADPQEQHSVFSWESPSDCELVRQLQSIVVANKENPAFSAKPTELDPALAQQLRALGYIK